MHRLHRFALSLLLLTIAAAPVHALTNGESAMLAEQASRCHALTRSTPHEAITLADRLLALPGLPAAVEISAASCRGSARNMLGQTSEERRQTIAHLQALLRTPGLPRKEHDSAQRLVVQLLIRDKQTAAALQLLESMLERDVAGNDIGGQLLTLGSIAIVHGELLNDAEGSARYRQQAIALSNHLHRPPRQQDMSLHYNYGYSLLQLQRYDEASQQFDHAERLARRFSGRDTLLHRIRGNRAQILQARGQPDAARKELLAILPWQQRNDRLGQIATLEYLARIALEQGDAHQARDLAEQAQTLANADAYVIRNRQRLDLLTEVNIALGDAAKANHYLQQARQFEQERMQGGDLAHLASLQARVEQVLDPVRVNAVQDAIRDRLLRNICLAALVASLLGGGIVYQRQRRKLRRWRQWANTDSITGLPSRRIAQRWLENSLHSSNAARSAVLLLEIHGLRELRVQHGYEAAEQLLGELSQHLGKLCDSRDQIAYWGEATFLVLRRDTNQAAAFALATHLCRQLGTLSAEAATRHGIDTTLCIGTSAHPPLPLATAVTSSDDTLHVALRALQAAYQPGQSGWAGIWAIEGSPTANALQCLLRDPVQARAEGWAVLGGSINSAWEAAPPE